MLQRSTIRKSVAVFLMLVMAFGVTPKSYLHDWFANHKDAKAKGQASSTASYNKSVFNCNTDNLVAESPFTGEVSNYEFKPLPDYRIEPGIKPVVFYSCTVVNSSLRGPPAA